MSMLFHESDWQDLAQAIDRDSTRMISAVSIFESSIVALARLGEDGCDELDLMLSRIKPEIRGFEPKDLSLVRSAYSRFGKGRHPAALNFGDCFSYALSVGTGEPLLFKGNDFSQTDVQIALYRDPESP